MQSGCKFSHERPEYPITATHNGETIVVVPGKKSLPAVADCSADAADAASASVGNGTVGRTAGEAVATKPRAVPISFGSINRTSPQPPTPEDCSIIYSPLGGLKANGTISKIIKPRIHTFSATKPGAQDKVGGFGYGYVTQTGISRISSSPGENHNRLAALQQRSSLPEDGAKQEPIGSSRPGLQHKESRIWGSGHKYFGSLMDSQENEVKVGILVKREGSETGVRSAENEDAERSVKDGVLKIGEVNMDGDCERLISL